MSADRKQRTGPEERGGGGGAGEIWGILARYSTTVGRCCDFRRGALAPERIRRQRYWERQPLEVVMEVFRCYTKIRNKAGQQCQEPRFS